MYKLLTIILALNYFYANGQYNFSFERPFQLNIDAPGNWSIYSNSGDFCNFYKSPSDGEKCMCLTKKEFNSKKKLYFFTQMIVNNNLQEIKNELLFKIDLRSNFDKKDSLKVVIKTFENDFTVIRESTEYLIPSELGDWSKYEIRHEVSSEKIMNIFFEFSYLGSSEKVEMDNLRLFIDGKAYNNLEIENDSDAADLITKYCYPISNFDIETANISHIFDNKTVIGLGENSHGCQEIQVLRNNIVQHLIKKKKFKNIILEDNYFRTHFLNVALQSKDTVAILSSVRGLNYWVNRHLEMYKLIRDISSYQNHINIFGCDFFLNKSFIELMSKDSNGSQADISLFKTHFGNMDFRSIIENDNIKEDWRKEKELFCALYPNESLSRFENEMTFKAFDYSLRKFVNKTSKFRDEGMFDLASDIIEHKGKSILLAHNGHIGYNKDRMGFLLKEQYGEKYVSLGFLFYEGNYAAMDTEELGEFNFKANDLTYESLFNKLPFDIFFIDLKELAKNKKLNKKFSPRGYYEIGATSEFSVKSFDVINLEKKFDYIIFIKKISPTKF